METDFPIYREKPKSLPWQTTLLLILPLTSILWLEALQSAHLELFIRTCCQRFQYKKLQCWLLNVSTTAAPIPSDPLAQRGLNDL
jgi:hypothetical protein